MALGKTRHGPLPWPTDDLQPQILCILWLNARNALGSIYQLTSIARDRTRRNLRGEGSVSEASRDHHLGQNLRPAQGAAIQELLSANSFAARTTFCDSYRSRSPGRQLCRRGIPRQELPSTPSRWPRAGTLTSWMQTDLHEVTFGWRPDRGRHQVSTMVGSTRVDTVNPGG
jgi:hypothetical protein